ncbi:MAG: serine/threonine-protein kinase [Aquihabitans sp.]
MRYETIRRLGRGGMGVVDLARDEDGREVALKRISLHGTPEELEKARQRIRREAEVLRQLDHPGIVTLIDVFDDGDDLVLVMDYLPGGNLYTLVNTEGPLPSAQVREIGNRLLDALAWAHRQGIVHRDIKPANVLFDADGNAALADFGAAIHRDATPGLTGTEMVMGTPGFMSPEQARGDDATAASDVFSLGATLAFAATGEGPFGTSDPRVLMLRAAAGRTQKLPRTISPDLRRRMEAMLDKDPLRRPTAAAVRGGTDGTRPHSVPKPRPRPNKRVLVAGAAVLALLVGIIGFALVSSARGADPAETVPFNLPVISIPEPCVDLPYQPCGQDEPAPNTDGRVCINGHADYDGDPTNGCEAAPDGNPPNLVLDEAIEGNIVPADEVDRFLLPVEDRFNLLGDGKLKVTLTAPAGSIMRLTVLSSSGKVLGTGISSGEETLVLTMQEPSRLGDDSTTLTIEVSLEPGAVPTEAPYRLTTSGSW